MKHHIVRIHTDTWERLLDLQRVHDLDLFRQTAKLLTEGQFEVSGRLSEVQIARLLKLGYTIDQVAEADVPVTELLREELDLEVPPDTRPEHET